MMQSYVNTRLLRNSNLENMVEAVSHPDLTLEVLRLRPNAGWGFHTLHYHPNFTFDWVLNFPERFWDWNRLSERVDIRTIATYPDMPWNWRIITERSSIDCISEFHFLPWDFNMICIRRIEDYHVPFLEKFQFRIPDWKWGRFAKVLSWRIFKRTTHLPWVWFISDVNVRTEEFLPEDVKIISDLEIICNWIKLTINIHIDIINANPDLPWNRDFLQWNRTTWNTKVEPVEKCVREWVAANTIKRRWKASISDPSFKMCRDRLRREFKELEGECTKMSTVGFYKLREDAIIPAAGASFESVGLDLHSVESYVVLPGQRVVVSTGLKVRLPNGVYGRIAPRSGLAVKHGLDVGAGVVDVDKEIRVVLFNHDEYKPFVIRPGYRIAQLILEKAMFPDIVEELYEDPCPSSV